MSEPSANEIAQTWMQQAQSDFSAGRILLHAEGVLPPQAAFHFQQAVEKALKAVLTAENVDYPKTHDLVLLVHLIRENIDVAVPQWADELAILNIYAVQTRYPGNWDPITQLELNDAEQIARSAVTWAAEISRKQP